MKKITEENIYILSLQKGVDVIKEGISYKEMKEYLKSKDYDVNAGSYFMYRVWFFENFLILGVNYKTDAGTRENVQRNDQSFMVNAEILKGMLRSEAYFDFLKYQEIQEIRASSRQAKNISWIAIAISTVMAAIQIWIELRR